MDEFSPVSDEEREDGEIVDDDLEAISDYSIPSCGKSDYNKGLLRAISLSSISDSDEGVCNERGKHFVEYITLSDDNNRKRYKCRRKCAVRKRRRNSSSTADITCKYGPGRHRKRQQSSQKIVISSPSPTYSDSDNSIDSADLQTIEDLNKAVRISLDDAQNGHHNTLKDRLQCMIQGKTSQNTLDIHATDNIEEIDKELEELRLQALKSAMIKKHMERKRRKELSELNARKDCNTEYNDKENTQDNMQPILQSTPKINTEEEEPVEEDIDIMRAMLLASMSKKITQDQPSQAVSPVPTIDGEKKCSSQMPIKLPPVKPLIIKINKDSETEDSDIDVQPTKTTKNNNVHSVVDDFLRKQREEYEASMAEKKSDNLDSDELDKSVLKHLPASQQEEYKQLKQKLLKAKEKNKTDVKALSETAKPKMSNGITKEKKERLQAKGKYKELVPIIRQINAEATQKRKCEELQKLLLDRLQKVRTQIKFHHQRFSTLKAQYTNLRNMIDFGQEKASKSLQIRQARLTNYKLRSFKKINTAQSRLKVQETSTVKLKTKVKVDTEPNKVPDCIQESNVISHLEESAPCIDNNANFETEVLQNVAVNVVNTEPLAYVSPLDKRTNNASSNPLKMMCPYELFGVCKDKNCTFNHCP